jgi:hypothetical protein
MFWTKKVDCDGCDAKIAQRGAIFHRGSYFCNDACRATWEQRNPPRQAQGDPAKLRADLVQTIDCALDEYKRAAAGPTAEQVVARMMPLVGKQQAAYQAQDRSEQRLRFTEYTHECLPIARTLGYQDEVAVLERFGFGARIGDVLAALERARMRAVSELRTR